MSCFLRVWFDYHLSGVSSFCDLFLEPRRTSLKFAVENSCPFSSFDPCSSCSPPPPLLPSSSSSLSSSSSSSSSSAGSNIQSWSETWRKKSVQFKDGLRRRLIRETKEIIVFIPRVSGHFIENFVPSSFSFQVNLMLGLSQS